MEEAERLAGDDGFWLAARERMWLEPGVAMLNTGTAGPVPKAALEACEVLRRRQAAGPSDFCWRQQPPRLADARRRLAGYLACDPADLLLLPGVTVAFNLVAQSLELPPGSEVLVGDHEYGGMRLMWKHYCRLRGWAYREWAMPHTAADPAEIVAAAAAAIRPATRVLFFSHVTCTTGLVLPAAELCALARERGVLSLVDGAHAPGMVPTPLDGPQGLGADFYGANCHKWLLTPLGAGFLHVRKERKADLLPPVATWGCDYPQDRPDEDSGWGGSWWHRNLEFHGTVDRCPQLVLPECLDVRASLGEEAIAARCAHLADHVRQRLGEIGWRPATAATYGPRGSLTAFDAPPLDPVPARDRLWHRHRVECPFTQAAGRTFLRVSTAWFTTKHDIERLAMALKAEAFA